jgi:glycosyltransferase involved in cell wall biosynthesis
MPIQPMTQPTVLRAGTPTISMCLAAFNGARFVTRQLRSILDQLRSADEIIVVDDASSDDTVAVIESLADPRLRVVRRTTNGGVSATFVEAILLASGDVIFLADQDDLWLPGKVEAVLERIAAGKDLVVHDAVVVRDGHAIVPSLFTARRSGPGVLRNIVRNSYTGCCIAFRRAILADVLPIPRSRWFFHDIWIGLAAELCGYEVDFLRRPLIEYTRHGGNVSARTALPVALRSRIAVAVEVGKYLLRRAARRITPTAGEHQSSRGARP